jgi:alpha-mannosidase
VIRHTDYTRGRLLRVSERLRAQVYAERRPPDELLVAGPVDRISWEEAQALDYRPAVPGERFGPLWSTWWLRFAATVPAEWDGRRVELLFTSLSEATLWRDGVVLQGLNTGGAGERPDALLADPARGGERLTCEIEVACNGMFGARHSSRGEAELVGCELALFDPDAWKLWLDFETLRALEAEVDLDPAWQGHLRGELNRFCNEGDPAILASLYEAGNGTIAHELRAIGHAHLDTAWLWPLAETYRKALRSFSSQVRYMDEYPEYRFACSQAVQLAWVEERNPDLWRRIREKVETGQFVPVGGAWVEPDCNLPTGESFLRQFLYGQRFYESRFGRRCTEFWCPDAFGYNGQLPQLMRLAGIDRFLTQKLSWNRFNRPDHHTFTWQGIDGSEVLGHFPPADNYNSDARVPELRTAARQYLDHDSSATSLLVFGHGDGGGGPTKDMLETLRRARDLEGLPRTTQTTAVEFFDALAAEPGPRPVVVGELYFEYHRGTYTSQAQIKRGVRRGERALHDAEALAVLAGDDYPRAVLERLWKLLLLQQFHDILPGSGIRLVVEDAERDLAEVEAGAEALCAAALPAGEVPVNTTGVERHEVAEAPDGRLVVVRTPQLGGGEVVEADDEVRVDGLVLENRHLRAELGRDGSLLSLVERGSGRETLAAPGNRLELYEDLPNDFDAWDVDPFHLETRRDSPPATSFEVVSAGPLRAEVAFERPLGERSRMRQIVRLDAGSRRLEFRCEVDWHERNTMLKACFPLAVRAPLATYEMPYGYAERPTHHSSAWDRARFEVPGHRFADLSEHGFGAAILTDSKYGYSCFGGDLRVSLLRSPTSPDPEADQGRHVFAYALMPHTGGWREGGVAEEALRLNAPIRWGAAAAGSFAAAEGGLLLDWVKRAEDSDALVLRLYEPFGARGTARLRLRDGSGRAVRANALEDDGEELAVEDGAVVIPFRPHEVVTVKLA